MKKARRSTPGPVSLAQLRAGFIALGSLLLVGLGASSWVVQQRLEEAKKDREEMVASRVFDEMEREISAFLESESERPRYSDLERTNPETWAPFVVGYFAEALPGRVATARIVGAEGSTSENKRRTAWALEQAFQGSSSERGGAPGQFVAPAPPANMPGEQVTDGAGPALGSAQAEPTKKLEAPAPIAQQKQASGTDIIQSLNRAPERRKVKPAAKEDQKNSDPFSDYSEKF